MPWLIDGSNLLGAMSADRHSDDDKRALVRNLAIFARAKKTRITCIFDGGEPANFGRHLGSVTVSFSGSRAADDLIAERAAHATGWRVVTSDRGLAARVDRRGVEIVRAAEFARDLELAATAEPAAESDWDQWFADPKNRAKF